MYKFSKFSKFISACFSLGILFSGLQTYGMNLDMLGIGRNRNQDDDTMSIETNETKSSVLDGIKAEFPEQCKFCSQRVLRVVAVPNSGDIFICRDNNCLKKIFDKFNIKLNTENIHRCEWFKNNMQNFQVAKAKGYENVWPFKVWKIFDEDKLVDEIFLPCGHSVCMCKKCFSDLLKNNGTIVCPTCKTSCKDGYCIHVCSVKRKDETSTQNCIKIVKLLSDKLKSEWKDIIVLYNKSFDVEYAAKAMFYCLVKHNPLGGYDFDEGRFKKIDDELSLGEKILFLDLTTNCGDSLKLISWNEFDDHIRSLKKYEKDKRIVYPTNGELYDKIQAAMNKCEQKVGKIFKKMQEDDVE